MVVRCFRGDEVVSVVGIRQRQCEVAVLKL